MSLSKILGSERRRLAAEQRADDLRSALDRSDGRLTQFRAANMVTNATVARLTAERDAAREDAECQRSMLNDEWRASARKDQVIAAIEMDRDFWKREAETLSRTLVATNAVLDRFVVREGRRILDGEVPPAPLRLVGS